MSKIENFSFIFKSNEKKKLPLKKLVSRRGYKKGGWKYSKQEEGALQERGGEKKSGRGLWPSKETMWWSQSIYLNWV